VADLKSATTESNYFSAGSALKSSDCTILRNDVIRFEDACYDPVYRLYVSLVLLAIMMIFCFFFLICLCYSTGEGDEEK